MASGPVCLYCGKKIAKRMHFLWFLSAAGNRVEPGSRRDNTVYLDDSPKTKEEAQLYTNYALTRVVFNHTGNVHQITWWEGEYEDPFFHTKTCAAAFGRSAARAGYRKG